MADLPSLPIDTDSYLADTGHLNTFEHGVYLLILFAMWRSPDLHIPNDDAKIAKIARTTTDKWKKVGALIRGLLVADAGGLTQKRLKKERGKLDAPEARNQSRFQSRSIGTGTKSLKSLGVKNDSVVTPLPFLLPTESEGRKERKEGRGRTLPEGWRPTEKDFSYGESLKLSRVEVEGMAEDMRLWARANSNRAVGRKADWEATFQGWMRREAGKRRPRNGASTGGGNAYARIAAAGAMFETERTDERFDSDLITPPLPG